MTREPAKDCVPPTGALRFGSRTLSRKPLSVTAVAAGPLPLFPLSLTGSCMNTRPLNSADRARRYRIELVSSSTRARQLMSPHSGVTYRKTSSATR